MDVLLSETTDLVEFNSNICDIYTDISSIHLTSDPQGGDCDQTGFLSAIHRRPSARYMTSGGTNGGWILGRA